jgi:ATP-binding cassette subfamily B protein
MRRAARIVELLKPYATKEAIILACIVTASFVAVVPALVSRHLIDSSLADHDLHAVGIDVLAMIAAAVAGSLIAVFQGNLASRVGQAITRDLRSKLVEHVHRLPLPFFVKTRAGEIMNRVANDVETVDGALIGVLSSLATNVLGTVVAIAAMLALDWRLTILSVLIVPLMILPSGIMGKRMHGMRTVTRQKRDDLGALLQDTLSLSGVLLIKSFVRQRFEAQRAAAVGSGLMDLEIRAANVGRLFNAAMSSMMIVGPAIVWMGGGYLIVHGLISIGTIVAFVALLSRLYMPTSSLLSVPLQFAAANAIFDRVFEYLDIPEEGAAAAASAPASPGRVSAYAALAFRDVQFSYGDGRPVLSDVTFEVRRGETVAFVGLSGSGKTTVANLIPRLYERTGGAILVDGVDVQTVSLDELRAHIGIITQETYLFHDTVESNIRYGDLDASRAQIEAAAKAANIDDVICALPDGYDTVVGDRGHRLSGGERQRVAIARILLKNPPILILDEATSALDALTEAHVQETFNQVMQGRTNIVIAHRLSTIQGADTIFVLDQGRIVERGRHADLIARGGAYAALYATQFDRGIQPLAGEAVA